VTADYLLVVFGVTVLVELGLPLLPARVLVATTNAVLNYCAYRWWTFRDGRARRDGRATHATTDEVPSS
jgi:putative flippase GtrA